MMVVKLVPRNRPKSNIGIDFRDRSRQAMKWLDSLIIYTDRL